MDIFWNYTMMKFLKKNTMKFHAQGSHTIYVHIIIPNNNYKFSNRLKQDIGFFKVPGATK